MSWGLWCVTLFGLAGAVFYLVAFDDWLMRLNGVLTIAFLAVAVPWSRKRQAARKREDEKFFSGDRRAP